MKKKKIIALGVSGVVVVGLTISFYFIVSSSNNEGANVPNYRVQFNSNGGTTIPDVYVKQGSKIIKPENPLKNGYYLLSWKYNDTDWNFETNTVQSEMTLIANWDYCTYTISYDLNGGTISGSNITNYNIDSKFDFVNPTKDGNVFIGWFNADGTRIDDIHQGMTGDLQLKAYWAEILIVESQDETKGTVKIYSGGIGSNKYTVENVPVDNKYHLFDGWYDDNNNLLSRETKYTFEANPNVVNYVCSKFISGSEEKEWNDLHGVNAVIHRDLGDYITYGMYPQTNVNDPETIAILEKLKPTTFNNYYYYNHEYYAKKIARLARDLNTHELLTIRKFDNGDEFIENETYWFKVEPVSWKILKESSNQYSLVSEKLLDVQRYHRNSSTRIIDEKTIYSNNYKYSDIREWLNNGFMSTTFTFNKSNLSIMEVDNSKESTATPDSGFECENTFDYVTLLSYKEYDKEQGNLDRRIKTTDYARVSGANYSVNSNNLFSGYCWTRSPIETEEDNGTAASRCNMNGTLNSDFVGWGGSCVQPSIKISK